jgi:hypothetical protein
VIVVGCSGHQRLPAGAEAAMVATLTTLLDERGPEVAGVCSLAPGADQLFARVLLDRHLALRVVVPSRGYERSFAEPGDVNRYRQLRDRATTVEVLPFAHPGEDAYLAAGQRVVQLSDVLLAVWDGLPARGPGGTADVVDEARRRGVDVVVAWPDGLTR